MILAGDVGGTKTVVALYELTDAGIREIRAREFASQKYPSLEAILSEFLDLGVTLPQVACFGVAGPIVDGKVQITNLPWRLDERTLAAFTQGRRAKLLNDLEATAYGMLFLRDEELAVLLEGQNPRREGNVAVIAAGTGLGEAFLYWDGKRYHPVASEGGHTSFSPQSEEEIDLLRYLRQRTPGHVSWERLLSGPGFHDIYSFLRDTGRELEPDWLRDQMDAAESAGHSSNEHITAAGLAHSCPLAERTLDLFVRLYGAEAGNLALKCLAMGGVYIGGGIAPKILPALRGGAFQRSFVQKGRFADLLASLTVRVSLNPRTGLLGAAHFARQLAESV